MYNNEQKLKLHKVVLEHKNTLLGMDNCYAGCEGEQFCNAQCPSSDKRDINTGTNVVHANVYRIMNGMA